MNLHKTLKALESHIKEEVRIHKEVLGEAKGDVKHLVKKHLKDAMAIHKVFWKDLKKAVKSK
jgi:hypothetical protein